MKKYLLYIMEMKQIASTPIHEEFLQKIEQLMKKTKLIRRVAV